MSRFAKFLTVGAFGLVVLVGVTVTRADNDGQADLDAAIETDFGGVKANCDKIIDLCQSALTKGLDQERADYCRRLLVDTLLRRAKSVAGFSEWRYMKPKEPAVDDWRAAVADVERALQIAPQQPASRLVMAKLQLLHHGDRQKAREALDEAIRLANATRLSLVESFESMELLGLAMRLDERDTKIKVEALILRSDLYDDLEDGIKDLSDAIALAPKDDDLLRLRGQRYLRRNKAEQALADFDEALALAPSSIVLPFDRAAALEALERYREAYDAYSAILEGFMPGEVFQAQFVAYVLLHRARASTMAADHQAALDDANRILQTDPDETLALLCRASSLAQLGRFAEAVPDIERAVELQPDSTYAIGLWAMITDKSGRLNGAMKRLRQQVEANPGDSVAWLQVALLYTAQRRFGKAIDAYGAAIELGQHRAFAYQQRADVYLNAGMHKEAIADYGESLKFDADNSAVLNNFAWVLATSPEAKFRDGKRALELALKACDLTSYQQAHILSTLAAAYAECGDFATARKWSEKSIELADDSIKDEYRKELASYEKDEPWRARSSEVQKPMAD